MKKVIAEKVSTTEQRILYQEEYQFIQINNPIETQKRTKKGTIYQIINTIGSINFYSEKTQNKNVNMLMYISHTVS